MYTPAMGKVLIVEVGMVVHSLVEVAADRLLESKSNYERRKGFLIKKETSFL